MQSVPALEERTRVIKLEGEVEQVFALFGPRQERDWAEGWDPNIVWPTDGTLQERMVFLRSPHGDRPETMWVVSRYDERQAVIEYTVFAPESVRWILIRCRAADDGQATEAKIAYTFVGTSESACQHNTRRLDALFRHDLRDWETAINHYLRTGERLSHH